MIEKTARNDVIDVKAIKARDRNEIGRMVDRYSPGIFGLALRMLGSEQDAEDVLQETFIKALKSFDSFEEELAQDVLEIITVFSARLYGSRSHKNRKLIETLREVAEQL